MIYLNEEGIQYAISMCRRRRGYRVGFVLASPRRIESIRNIIMYYLGGANDYETHDFRMSRDFDVYFENGSRIEIIPHSGRARGYKAHLLVIDEDTDYMLMRDVYAHVECLEEVEARRRHIERREINLEWFNKDWFVAPSLNTEKEISDVSEDEFLKVIAG